MQRKTKNSGGAGRRLALFLAVSGIAAAMIIPPSAGAGGFVSAADMTLVFAGSNANTVADNVAVPVKCLGDNGGFCSGEVTLSRSGHHISIPFSVHGGGEEVLFVPLRVHGRRTHPRKVHGVATTVQPRGPATSTKTFLYAK
jgi:hypothetical protein